MVQSFKLRWWSLCLLFVVVLASAVLLQARVAQAINTPWLTVSGRYIKDPNGNIVILRGVSIVDVSVADSRSRNAPALIDMATDNANGWYTRVMRFPVYPEAIDGQPGWIANPDTYFNTHLNPAIQRCVSKQIYCIIDWHYISDYNSSTVDTATRNFWNYVAPKYKDVPNVIFELYNEPINPDSWSTWKTWAQPWVNIIRAVAPNNLILIGGPRWSQNVAEAATNPFSGGNIAYVAHIYPEHGGQSTWDSWFGNSSSTVPYFITEWGWQNGGTSPTSGTLSGYGTPFSNYLDSKGVSWTAWVFDLYWQPVMFDTNWNLLGGENYMGQFTKDFLYQHRNDNLPGGVTPTATSTRAQTPTPTSTVDPATILRVQYRAADSSATTNQIKPHLNIINLGSSAIPLSELTVRYWYTIDGERPQQYHCDYAVIGCGIVSGSFVKLSTAVDGADTYLEVSFSGGTLAAGGQTGEIQNRFNKDNWTSYTQSNDYSFDDTKTAFGDWTRVTLYRSGVRVWGTEPGGTGPTGTPTPTPTNTPTPTKTNTPTITPTGNLPDLVITSIVFDGGTPVTCGPPPSDMGDRVYIQNQGTAAAGPFSITLNGNRQTVNGLAAGQSTSVLFPVLVMSASAVVDVDNQVAESNEGNNTFTVSLPMPTPPPTCTPTPTVTPTRTPTPGPGGCAVTYTPNQWNTGFTADVKITNNGSTAIQGWALTWSFANGQQITNSWNATVVQTGANVSASNPAGNWNGTIGANGGSVSFGFQAMHTGTNARPASFVLNGVACQ